MLTKPLGQPNEDMVEYQRTNPTSFGANISDDYLYESMRDGIPARPSHVHDTVAYNPAPVEDSWLARLHGWAVSPARVSAGTSGTMRRGSVP